MKGEKDNTQPASADTVVVLDFETTGLSPGLGERPIEVGAVLLEKLCSIYSLVIPILETL